jgi:hypothetical protein|tara:strand:+ start:355 stop:588 length:234 start_codon:yes stop_codon:yes gene_type:complete
MSNGIRIKLKDDVYISIIQVAAHEKNILGVKGIREKGSVEAVLMSVDKEGNSTGLINKVEKLSNTDELIDYIKRMKE